MSIGDACVEVYCDRFGCDYMERIYLTAIAFERAWDERNVDKELESMGWVIESSDDYICPNCIEDDELRAEDPNPVFDPIIEED